MTASRGIYKPRSKRFVDDNGRDCSGCGEYRLWAEYNNSARGYHGKQNTCKHCRRTNYLLLKVTAFLKYGPFCVCCGETEPMFLTIDHTNNDGAEQRRSGLSGDKFYKYLIDNPKSPDYQVMCWNCNSGRYVNGGICPHKEER